MAKKFTIDDFINKAKEIHGNKYDYSKVEYKNCDTKVCIICPIHGEFWQTPYNHIKNKQNCPLCSRKKNNDCLRLTLSDFLVKAKNVHGDCYDYSKVKYSNSQTKICIVCQEHGEFWQTPANHLRGQGCPICRYTKSRNTLKKDVNNFIQEANEVHKGKYDYTSVVYKNNHTKVNIICPIHGIFSQTPYNHLQGQGCPHCRNIRISKSKTSNTCEFIYKAKQVHGNKYDYSKTSYITKDKRVCIICPTHGEFWQTPHVHLRGGGCQQCHQSKLECNILKLLNDNNINVIPQYKFDWLGLQSIDFYLPYHNIAIECQGVQHFKEVEHFGGSENFKITQERDKRKKKLIEEHGIKLLYYTNLNEYDTFLGEKLIKNGNDLITEITQINL